MKMKEVLIYIAIVLALVIVDQLSKYLAFKFLTPYESYRCIPHIVRFDLLYNQGAVFGILQKKQVLFFIVTAIGLFTFGFLLTKGSIKEYPFYTIGLLLMIGGTIGNFIDRFLSLFSSTGILGVRDFITFDFFNFASFNFADMCMCCGVVMLAIDIIFGEVLSKWK